jgi:phosphoribosylaminoimidazole-succinocarboxamide synthase
LPEPIFTPTTKADVGVHDESITFAQMEKMVGAQVAARVRDLTLALYVEGARYAAGRGIIIADTKFEFGLDSSGSVVWIDEALTPDSSRFWPKEGYAPGRSQPSYDKQFVRDYLVSVAWNKRPPAPSLPPGVIATTSMKYVEALEQLTGQTVR